MRFVFYFSVFLFNYVVVNFYLCHVVIVLCFNYSPIFIYFVVYLFYFIVFLFYFWSSCCWAQGPSFWCLFSNPFLQAQHSTLVGFTKKASSISNRTNKPGPKHARAQSTPGPSTAGLRTEGQTAFLLFPLCDGHAWLHGCFHRTPSLHVSQLVPSVHEPCTAPGHATAACPRSQALAHVLLLFEPANS